MADARDERAAALATEPLRPAGPRPGFVGGTFASIRDIVAHRELLGLLTKREVKARYKDSALGLVWSLGRPIAMLCIYWLVIGQFLGAARGTPDFAVYIFAGMTAWQLFADIVQQGTSSIVLNAGLIKKVYVPREVFPLASTGAALFNFALQMVILLAFTVQQGVFPTGARWLWAAYGLVVLLVWGQTLSLFFTAVNVYLRDIQYLVEIGLLLFMWVSPILYQWSFAADRLPDWIMKIYLANPVTLVVLAFQRAFWITGDNAVHDPGPDGVFRTPDDGINYDPRPLDFLAERLGIVLVVSLVLLWLAQRIFARLQSNFAQEL
jgi:ABC-2 type transport system permease protein